MRIFTPPGSVIENEEHRYSFSVKCSKILNIRNLAHTEASHKLQYEIRRKYLQGDQTKCRQMFI